ncbi:TPA: DUF1493 family protein [Serratia odorifera]|jgi:hypothetical protein
MNEANEVHQLLKKYFWEMSDDASLSTGKKSVLPEDAYDFLEEYADKMHVDMDNFEFRKYFPNRGIWFLPNAILPKHMQTDRHEPAELTVEMLIKSAKAGRWLYD